MIYPIELGLTLFSLGIWVGLLGWRGQFWRSDQKLEQIPLVSPSHAGKYPSVCVVIPARNESELLPITLRSLLTQDYPGQVTLFLVDDHSTDGTAAIAEAMAEDELESDPTRIHVVAGEPLPRGWTGKLWAIEQGIQQAQSFSPDYFLLTDADIEHEPGGLSRLVAKAQRDRLDLVSLMVKLRVQSFWEYLLVPAFIFFFQKLYPFRWVNDPDRATAAAAGGCILLRRSALERIGGIQTVRQALIDDCALAKAIKDQVDPSGKIWLGLSEDTRSLRAYPSLGSLWEMVARTAFTQLNYSPLLLFGTSVGMMLMYVMPIFSTMIGFLTQEWSLVTVGTIVWLMMAYSYIPTLRLYHCSPMISLVLPIIAFLYILMTLDSALRHWQGRGGAWKGRSYSTMINSQS